MGKTHINGLPRPHALFALLSFIILAGVVAACWRRIDNPEVLFNLRLGQVILRGDLVPNRDIFSCTSSMGLWHNFSWLWGLVLALLFKTREWLAVTIGLVSVVGLLAIINAVRCRLSSGLWFYSLLVTALVLATLLPVLQPTPFLGSLFLFAFSLLLSERLYHRWQYILYPAVAAAWINIHPSAVLVVLVPLCRLIAPVKPAPGNSRLSVTRVMMGVVLVAGVLGLLINPGSVGAIRALFKLLAVQWQQVPGNVATVMASPSLLFQFALAAVFTALVNFRRTMLPYQCIVAGVLAAASIILSPYAVAYFIVYMSAPAAGALATVLAGTFRGSLGIRVSAAVGLLLTCLAVLSLMLFTNRITPDAFGAGIRKGLFPETAAGRLASLPSRSTLLNETEDAYYLMWRLWPTWKISIDDRPGFYTAEFRRTHELLWKGPDNWNDLFSSWRINAVMGRPDKLDHYGAPNLYNRLADSPDWQAVYWDSHSILYLRADMDISASNLEAFRQLKPGLTWNDHMNRITQPDQWRELAADLRRALVDDPDNAVAHEFLARAENQLTH